MTTVGFIGLGLMGGPMAANLVRAGFDVAGYNRSRGKVDWLVEQGGRPAASTAEAVQDADAVVTMLPDSPDVQRVVLGDGGVLAHAGEGALCIDCSTVAPGTSRTVAAAAEERGLRALDAPVSGGDTGAAEGSLSIMVGGDAAHVEAARPIFDVLGATVVHVGPHGSGQTVKAANQLIAAGTLGLVAEAIVFLEAYGVDTEAATRVLSGGMAGSRILDRKSAGMLARTYEPGFRAELHDKDLAIATAAAREMGVATPLGALAAQLMSSVNVQGHGKLDHSALLEIVEQLSGRRSGPA